MRGFGKVWSRVRHFIVEQLWKPFFSVAILLVLLFVGISFYEFIFESGTNIKDSFDKVNTLVIGTATLCFLSIEYRRLDSSARRKNKVFLEVSVELFAATIFFVMLLLMTGILPTFSKTAEAKSSTWGVFIWDVLEAIVTLAILSLLVFGLLFLCSALYKILTTTVKIEK